MIRLDRALTMAAVAALAAALALAGCTSIPPAPAWSPRAADPAALELGTGEVTATPPGTPDAGIDPSATDPASTQPATPSPATPAAPAAEPAITTPPAVSGLDVRLLSNADPASPVGARWGEIPGNQPFTQLLRDRVTAAIAEHAALTGTPYRPAANAPAIPPEQRGCVPGSTTRPAEELIADPAFTPPSPNGAPTLTVTCEIVAAAGSILVEALRVTTATGGQITADQTTIYYAETSGAFVTTSDTLISDDGLRALLPQIVQSLKVRAGALQPAMTESMDDFPIEQLRALFAHFSFAADGALVLHLPDDFSTPELDRLAGAATARPNPFFVTVPAATATGYLSEQGRQVQAVLASGAAVTLPAAPWRGQESIDCGLFACVAVTFDDGPGEFTDQVLDDLDARRAAATFFVQGYRVVQHTGTMARMSAEGHEIGNHTWNHPDLTKLTDEQIKDQLERTSSAVKAATGSRPTTFRPPYGAVDQRVLAQTSLPAILWTIDTNDWQIPDDATLLARAVDGANPGSIVLLHDVHDNTARMTPAILDGLLGRGFTLVTVQQLLGGSLPAPHTTTSHG
ncbi:polysaccharide deacetylase family protein [Herbiconiux sp.]|uniref:polysaccharide deacetylase family protein n=1 Tax=Herbiconiux sp. TaxID=1871186 RepID=UPI0025B9FCBC|nr:polysaccharide deacetylase family protein [Herbiconiux sp.]